MVPGLALFHGGMITAKSVLNTIMMTLGAVALVGCVWVVHSFSASPATRSAAPETWETSPSYSTRTI
ncbi:hypothetical protein [Streptomyces sp. ATMOS53]